MPVDVLCFPLSLSHLQLENGGCGPFKISATPSTHIQLRRKRGMGVLPHRVFLVRVDRTPFTLKGVGQTDPIHTLGGVVCDVSNGTETNIRLQFHLVYSSGFTGPLYFDVTESPSRHCQ